MVSYARSTYEKSKQFNEKLNELQKTVKPIVIRTYLAAEKPVDAAASLGLTDEQISQIEELKALRMSGIQGEMKYAAAQASKNGIELSEDILSGKPILPGFSPDLLEKVPSLGVYDLFLLFTEEEFDTYL